MKTMIAVVAMLGVLSAAGHAEPESEPQADDGVPAITDAGAVEVPAMVLAQNDDQDLKMLEAKMHVARMKLVKSGQIQKKRSTWQTNKNGDRVCAEQADYVAGYLQGKNISGYFPSAGGRELKGLMRPSGKLPPGYKVTREQNRNVHSYIPGLQEKEVQHRWVNVETPKHKHVTLDPWANKAFKGKAPADYARKDVKTRVTTIRETVPPLDLPDLPSPPRLP
ncbi:MAG: hypothetical protein WC969_09120 [Elusimicrobiota bacterium]|jgi:hypothetical protein